MVLDLQVSTVRDSEGARDDPERLWVLGWNRGTPEGGGSCAGFRTRECAAVGKVSRGQHKLDLRVHKEVRSGQRRSV